MNALTVRRIINPTDDEIERGVTLLTAAFRAAPGTFDDSLTGGDRDISPGLHRANLRAAAVGGELWVAGFGPTDISAVAVWFGPGTSYLATEEQRAAGWTDVQSKFTPELQRWWSEYYIPRYDAWNESCLGAGTKHQSWHLQLLGTDPTKQRSGLAATLIQAVEERITDGTMMCLETTNDPNVAFYKKRGFQVCGDPLSIVGVGGETTMTCLAKDVKRKAVQD
ncbi:hypothetical protein C8R43DRAFT_230382 [Mycena crocata]|nr:hypothetical protein C8R43DRAFT_230382 [Mycena crocata]